jgi:hypothetical protein
LRWGAARARARRRQQCEAPNARQTLSLRAARGGLNYDWTRDHNIKVAAADTGGAYALIEDNLKHEFALALHPHRAHAETFYILAGIVNF